MSGVFQNIDYTHPLTARRVCTSPAIGGGGGHTRWVERGWGVNILEDARHCSVLFICKYFVIHIHKHQHAGKLRDGERTIERAKEEEDNHPIELIELLWGFANIATIAAVTCLCCHTKLCTLSTC